MKRNIVGLFMAMVLLAATGVRADDGLGIGIIVGEPTGLSIKKWIASDRAVDAAAAWSFSENESFQLHADYLVHNFDILKTGSVGGRLPLYAGIGGRIKFDGHDHNDHSTLLGVRIPLGIAYMFAKDPIDIFAEIVPILDVVPSTEFDINAAIGARFYFR
jgi:hypothetical protein